jgi:hypothetical protein
MFCEWAAKRDWKFTGYRELKALLAILPDFPGPGVCRVPNLLV